MAADLPVPIYTDLESLYADLGTAVDHAPRWTALAEDFQARFGRKPAYIARAPGRVNLIGEHIDYALFGVLPTAIERDILIACAPHTSSTEPGTVDAQNRAPVYTPRVFAPVRRASETGNDQGARIEEWHLEIDKKELRWESYVKAGYYGVLQTFFPPSASPPTTQPVPVDLLVTGTVPAGSGLSSSAAMVVASTLAFLATNDKLSGITKGELVRLAVENEQRVGVNSGGMDQAASVISTPASALYVAFYPRLRAAPVRLPPRAALVVAHSLVTSEKAVHARTRYNLRVVETRVAARVLCHKLGLPLKDERERPTLREVAGRFAGEPEVGWSVGEEEAGGKLENAIRGLLSKLDVLVPEEQGRTGVTVEEMVAWTGMDTALFKEVFIDWIDVQAELFELHKRTTHVLSEALRVLAFRTTCDRAFSSSSTATDEEEERVLRDLGTLMIESQTSCAELYACSCPALDTLVALALSCGAYAYGARLTGAGWGGCAVALVDITRVDAFIHALREGYEPYKALSDEEFDEAVFATRPSSGACVFKCED